MNDNIKNEISKIESQINTFGIPIDYKTKLQEHKAVLEIMLLKNIGWKKAVREYHNHWK
ncbi:MAG: hypothetical protein ABIJ97_03135 [Bacteroidota bacterium]